MVDKVVLPRREDTLWAPEVGVSFERFLASSKLDAAAAGAFSAKTQSILAGCVPPRARGDLVRTGLVVGYVQSGKTMSFTGLTALARDAGYPLVVLLAGTKKNLRGQTASRLEQELSRDGGKRSWLFVDNLGPKTPQFAQVANSIGAKTSAGEFAARARTVVTTVMKNRTSLDRLSTALVQLRSKGALHPEEPILIIDDEADQAGLNTRDDRDKSPTYEAILRLRTHAGSHSYVMYTATPQAPLLLQLSDQLSPDFVRVLQPGDEYTGGRYFFSDHVSDFVRQIDADEVAAVSADLSSSEMVCLERALAVFLLGRAADPSDEPRSMLVHPSSSTSPHQQVSNWIEARVKGFAKTIELGGVDLQDLRERVFDSAWEDLNSTVPQLPPLEVLLPEVRAVAMLELAVRVVNSAAGGDDIDWDDARAWVVVGGFKLDRGFTVEGLTVTYMPRGVGVGNADSIQQRARFFGYKRSYAHLCRAWLDATLDVAFRKYVVHEAHLMNELQLVESEGLNLRQWKRRMLLDPGLKPCRSSVVSLEHVRLAIRGGGWMQLANFNSQRTPSNGQLLARVEWANSVMHPADTRERPDSQKHRSINVPVNEFVEKVLDDWSVVGADAARFYQLELVLAAALDRDPEACVELVMMDAGEIRTRKLLRDPLRVENLQSGRSGKYLGDSSVRHPESVSIQFHYISDSEGRVPGVTLAIAAHFPDWVRSGVILGVDW